MKKQTLTRQQEVQKTVDEIANRVMLSNIKSTFQYRGEWINGRFTIPCANQPEIPIVYRLQALKFTEPSENGINGGHVSKLFVFRDGEQVFNFDRGLEYDRLPAVILNAILQRLGN